MRGLIANGFSLYLRYLPWRKGKKRLSRWIGPFCEGVALRTAYGFPMYARFHDNTNRLCFEGRPDVVTDFVNDVPSGAVFVDVGANQGAVALQAARKVRQRGVVLAFEPSSVTVGRLEANIRLNGIDNIKVFQHGLGAEAKVAQHGTPDPLHSGAAFIGGGDETVSIGPLSDLPEAMAQLDGRPVYIKIDTEGYELEALKGLRGLLTGQRVQALVIEIDRDNMRRFSAEPSEVYEFLERFGYQSSVTSREAHYDAVFTLTAPRGHE